MTPTAISALFASPQETITRDPSPEIAILGAH